MTARMRSGIAPQHNTDWPDTWALSGHEHPPRQSEQINRWADRIVLSIAIVSIIFFTLGLL